MLKEEAAHAVQMHEWWLISHYCTCVFQVCGHHVCILSWVFACFPEKAMKVLLSCLDSNVTETCCMGASGLWALLHNNQRVNVHTRTRIQCLHAFIKGSGTPGERVVYL